jgi:hypothetical protein
MKITDITPNDPTIYVGILTETQKNQLVGQLLTNDNYFNPVQDIDNNWFISTQQIINCDNINFTWVKNLDLIVYKPKSDDINP